MQRSNRLTYPLHAAFPECYLLVVLVLVFILLQIFFFDDV